jgi:23S rRNA pseudouridine1911/1915/1917 synthase
VMLWLKWYEHTLARKQLVEEFSAWEEYGLLNRLDTDTSGLLYFARSRDLYTQFRDLQRAGNVEKYYLAQVWWEVRRNVEKNIGNSEFYALVQEDTQDIVLRFPIMHHRHDDERMISCQTNEWTKKLARQGRGKVLEIESIVTPLSYDPVSNTSIVRVLIHQGVRHQIRVHLATLGNPIIGDVLYGKWGGILQLVSAGARVL